MAAKGFAYSAPTIGLDVYGVKAEVKAGDVATISAIDEACAKIFELDAKSQWDELSDILRGCIRAVVGDAAFDEALGGRAANVIEEMELLAYIRERIAESLSGNELSSAVARLVGKG